MKNVKENIKIPLVCFGGIWEWSHLSNAIDNGMDALGIGNVLHFREHSIIHAKKYLKNNGYNVRKPEFFNYNYSRNPNYDDVLLNDYILYKVFIPFKCKASNIF